MTVIQCKLAESVELCANEEKIVNVIAGKLIGIDEMVEVQSEVAGLSINEQNADFAYGSVGDGSDSIVMMVRNELNCGIQLDPGTVVASGTLVKGITTGRANCSTMEIIPDVGTADETSVSDHKFAKLLWLPITVTHVIVYCHGIGRFDMGIQMSQDKYGLAFEIDLAIDNDPLMGEIYSGTFKGVTTVQHTLASDVLAWLAVLQGRVNYQPIQARPR